MYPDAAWLHNQGLLPSEKPVVLCEYSHAMGNSNGSFDYMWDEFINSPICREDLFGTGWIRA